MARPKDPKVTLRKAIENRLKDAKKTLRAEEKVKPEGEGRDLAHSIAAKSVDLAASQAKVETLEELLEDDALVNEVFGDEAETE